MGALRSVMGGRTLKALPKKEAMILIAGSRHGEATSDAWLKYLKSHPRIAKRLGEAATRMRQNFAQAYPGETREETFSTADWQKAGYDYVAEMNKAMAIEGS